MRRIPAVAAALGAAVLLVPGAAVAAPGDLLRVSVADNGDQSPLGGFRGVVSADGRYVAFLSSSQLTATPTNGKVQLYVRDRVAGRTVIASAAGGQGANQDVEAGDFFNPFHDISGNGRYVVFVSTATNLVSPDANATLADVFRADTQTGQIVVVSRNAAGEQGNQSVQGDPGISFDGSRVAFTTGTATNFVPNDLSAANDVVLRDVAAGTTTLVSRNTAGAQANDFAERPAISADGRVVAFEAGPMTTNLYENDNNAVNDIVVHNTATGTTVPAAIAADGTVPGGNIPDISGDGRYVVFQTSAKLDPTNDGNAANDVYRRDLVAGVSTLISAKDGVPGNSAQGGSFAAVSADGGRVAFTSPDVDLVAGDNNNQTDVFTRLPATNRTQRASERADRSEVNNGSETGIVSGNGGAVTFASLGPFATGDNNNADDVHAKEFDPTDVTAPTVTVALNPAPGSAQIVVSGTVGADPSGIGQLSVNGTPVRPAADGTYSLEIPPGPLNSGGEAITTAGVVVMDGAGNRAEATGSFTVAAAPRPATIAPRLTRATARVVKGRLVVRFRLGRSAVVRTQVQRPVRRRVGGTTRVRFVNVGRPVRRVFRAGLRSVTLPAPRTAGTYRVRFIVSAAGRSRVVTVAFRVR